MKIGPTGKCFDHALDEFQRLVKEDSKRKWNNEYLLAHGILTHESGKLYSHAWLEHKGLECVDFGIMLEGKYKGKLCMFTVDKPEYYRGHNVVDVTLYTWDEAWRWNVIMNNFGPWLPKYRELCRN